MREIVRRTPASERIGFVSFSVDPERDTPERLRALAESYQADRARWSFVTGPGDALYDVVVKGFRVGMGPKLVVGAPPDIYDISHGEPFVVVGTPERACARFFPIATRAILTASSPWPDRLPTKRTATLRASSLELRKTARDKAFPRSRPRKTPPSAFCRRAARLRFEPR
jgi:hypothetical protein